MIYTVKARYREDRLKEFYKKLFDGTILKQKPDGKEVAASMERARVTAPGVIEWSEMCFCPTPLKHERETVFDLYLKDIETQEVPDYVEFEGEPFMDVLEKASGG